MIKKPVRIAYLNCNANQLKMVSNAHMTDMNQLLTVSLIDDN